MSIYIHKIKHKLWESYIYNPPLKYSYFKFWAKSEHTFNKINENNKKKIIEFEQILLMTGDSFNYELMLSKKNNLIDRLTQEDIKYLIAPTNKSKIDALYYLKNNPIIEKKIRVVNPSINLMRFKNRLNKKNTIKEKLNLLFIGQRFYGKGGPICFEIANELNKRKINFKFKFVSRDVPDNYDIPENVEIINYKISEDKKYELYNWAHLFLFPVVQDSFGVYLECIESCTPIISTNIFDKSDIIIDNEMGRMIETPFQLYDYTKFGTRWKNWEEFNKCFISEFNRGLFNDMIVNFIKAIEYYLTYPEMYEKVINNIERIAIEKFHPQKRNNTLLSIYKNL